MSNVKLPGYQSKSTYARVALCDSVAQEALAESLNVLLIENTEATLLPEGFRTAFPEAQLCEVRKLENYDVVTIDSRGNMRTVYRTASLDNAIVITEMCNSNCVMCPSSDHCRKAGGIAPLDDLIRLTEHFPSDAPHLTITGGEPFLLGRDLFRLFERIAKAFPRTDFLLLTNGRALSIPSFREQLAQTMPPEMRLGIPLHGSTPELHDAITRAPGSFRQTFDALKWLTNKGLHVELRIVVSALNAHDITDICRLVARELPGVESVKFIGLEMLGNAWVNRDKVWITYAEAFQASKEGIELLVRSAIDVRLYNFPLCAVNRGFWHACAKSITDYKVTFPEECDGCLVADSCCGIFAGSCKQARYCIEPILEP